MKGITKEQAEVVFEGDGAELRRQEISDGQVVVFATVPGGMDFGPALAGLPEDMCQCPHWGYMLKGKIKMRTPDGNEEIYEAGQAYYWAPGHAPETIEDSEWVEFSPGDEFERVMDHITSQG